MTKNTQGRRSSPSCMSHDLNHVDDEALSALSSTSLPTDKQDVYATISAMLQKEKYYCCHNYLEGCNTGESDPYSQERVAIGISNRAKVCEWMFQIVDHNPVFERETAIIAMSFLDRYMCSNSTLVVKAERLNLKAYALAAMACMYIAIKISGKYMNARVLCRFSGLHSEDELVACESHVLSTLKWKLNGPTALQFVDYMLKLIPASFRALAPKLHAHCCLQTELAVGNYAMVGLNRSTIAMASILNSIAQIDFPLQMRIEYMHQVSSVFGIAIESPFVYAARGRLLDSLAIQAEESLARRDSTQPESTRKETSTQAEIQSQDEDINCNREAFSCIEGYEILSCFY